MSSRRLGLVAVLAASSAGLMPTPIMSDRAREADRTYFVSASGNDRAGKPNDPSAPYRSPQGAYAAIPGDITLGAGDHVILLMDGTVYGQLAMTPKVTDSAHRIILRAAPGTSPSLDAHSVADGSAGRGDNNPSLRIQTSNVVVQGMRFHNTSLDTTIARHQVMVRIDGSNVVIERNYFDGNGRSPTPFDMFLLVCAGASDNLISGNRFDFSGGKGLIYVGAGCGGGSPGKQTIRNNALSRFGNNPQGICAAINFGGSSGSLAGNHSIVENNTIYDNGGACYGLLNTNGSALTVRNNIFSTITGPRFAIGCSGVNGSSGGTAYNSVMHGNTNNVEATCAGGGGWALSTYYTEDPYFVDPGATPPDLHVESTVGSRRNGLPGWFIDRRCSVAIDKGSPTDAFDMEPVPNGGRRNLGAYGNTPEASKTCRQETPLLQGLDHVMVAVKNLPEAAERYKSLGFALKPGQPHANGIANQHVKFPDGSELELITAPAAVDAMTANYLAHLRGGDGPAYAGFFAPDRPRLASQLVALKLTTSPSGTITTFPMESPLRHLFFGSRNKSPTDRPEHFAHANGATSLIGVWIAASEPDTRQLLSNLGVPFEAVEIDLPTPTKVERGRLPEGEVLITPAARQTVHSRRIVGVTMSTTSVELVKTALAKAPPAVRDAAIVKGRSVFLPPSVTHGIWIELREQEYREP